MSQANLVIRKEDGKIDSYKGHYRSIAYLLQDHGLLNGDIDSVLKEEFEDGCRFEKVGGVWPYDAGITVVDFKTKQIFDCQSGFDLHTELYMKKKDIPKDRKVIQKTESGVFYTNAPRVKELIENGWNILIYAFTGHGIVSALHHIERDLAEVGIKATKPTAWWDYQNTHYLWAMIPQREAYKEDGKLKSFPALTTEQKRVLQMLIEKAEPDKEREGTYSGEYAIPEFPARKNAEMKALRQLEAKGFIECGCSGSVWTGTTVIRFSIGKEVVEAHVSN